MAKLVTRVARSRTRLVKARARSLTIFTPGVVVVFWWVGEKVVLSLSFKDPEGKFLFLFKIANILP